ncbi:kinase domain-containing protein [Aspergillus heterothallicus]
MELQCQFPKVHYIWEGGISFVYEVDPRIVVKVPQNEDFARQQFKKELEIYRIFSQHPPCPSIISCFLHTDNGIFLEYMRDGPLASRIQNNHTKDRETGAVIKVGKLEPLTLRKQWMNELTQAVLFLESLNLAHGDLRPENILLDRDRLKLCDFDSTAEIGTYFEACMAPYGRQLMKDEMDENGEYGGSGYLGPRTEQFALGSIFYFINYGFEVYGDRRLTEDPREHGRKVVVELRNMEFPELNGDPVLDGLIGKCWHNKYARIADLAVETREVLLAAQGEEALQGEESDGDDQCAESAGVGEVVRKDTVVEQRDCIAGVGLTDSDEDFTSKRALCLDFEERGLLEMLSSADPEELGFKVEWYRHSEKN